MLSNHISSALVNNFEYAPTPGQQILLEKLGQFITSKTQDEIFLIKGYAGTGKTSIIGSLVKALGNFKIKTVLMAPTGRAAKVLSNSSGNRAYTIHKKIYRQISSKDGFGKFVLETNLHKNTFFIVDEASMISNDSLELAIFGSGHLLDDLIEYVYQGYNCKLVIIGDTAQLPPVGLSVSPALDMAILKKYEMAVYEVELTDVVRHELNSGILSNATNIRKLISEFNFNREFPKIELTGFSDIKRIGGQDLIEELSNSYHQYGRDETMVVSRSNKRANQFNQGIRNAILWRDTEIGIGDFLMVVKNNYYWITENEEIDFIANGDIFEITRIHGYQERYGYKFADVTLCFTDYKDFEIEAKIFLSTLQIEAASLPSDDMKKFFNDVAEDYPDEKNLKQRYKKVKEDPFFNALQVKFAYAVTCHKAQGGQWKAIFVDQGYFVESMLDIEYLRWLYTAFTRPVEKLYLVNFDKKFFNDND